MLVQHGAKAPCSARQTLSKSPDLSVQTTPPRRLLLLATLAALAGCAVQPQVKPTAPPASGNELRILVFRGGAAARLGHNHVLRASDLKVDWTTAGPVLRFRLDALDIDPPALRAGLGPAFASTVDDDDRAGTRNNLLKALDAAAHPEVVVRSLQQVGDGPRRAVEAEITLHGATRHQWFVVQVDGKRASGEVVIRQSDFAVQPFTVMGGLLAVQDALVVQFQLTEN